MTAVTVGRDLALAHAFHGAFKRFEDSLQTLSAVDPAVVG
jgi:hypothetical protein